ncbi:MAG: Ycf66 family protein [Microcystaceae cyanobacterium]
MVNFGLNSASILGIFLAVAGAGLYFLRTVRPELSRDHDIFFAAVGLLCGLILLFQGWRLDPILQFGQFLLTGSAIFFAVETVRLRGATVEQAKRSGPVVDRDRSVSRTRVYTEAELDEIEPYEEETRYDNPRLQGYDDPRNSRRSRYENEDSRRSRSRRSTPTDSYNDYGDRSPESSRSRRSRRRPTPSDYENDSWESPSDMWDDTPPSSRRSRSRNTEDYSSSSERSSSSRKRRSRPAPSSYENYYPDTEPNPSDYVDYQPVDEPDAAPPQDDWEQTPPDKEPRRPRSERPTREDYDEGEVSNQDNPSRFDY